MKGSLCKRGIATFLLTRYKYGMGDNKNDSTIRQKAGHTGSSATSGLTCISQSRLEKKSLIMELQAPVRRLLLGSDPVLNLNNQSDYSSRLISK